jgi:hypothetical protein
MRFEIVQDFPFEAAEVQAAYLDESFLVGMGSLPRLGAPELLESSDQGSVIERRIRYRFAGDLNSAVRAVVDPQRLTWVEESRTDTDTLTTAWVIRPDHYADKLTGRGTFVISSTEAGCRRTAAGEIKVNVFLVGGKVEGAIVSGMREHAVLERDALMAHLRG